MLTIRQQEKLVSRFETLSELEADAVIADLAEWVKKNNLYHLIENHFGGTEKDEEIEGLEDTVRELEEEKDKLEDRLLEINNECLSVEDLEDFEDGAFDQLMKAIKEIKTISE